MAANVNNYIAAANAAVSKNIQIRKALADNKPNYANLANASVNQAARNRANAAENNASTAQTAIRGKTLVEGEKIKADTEKDIRGINKKARMTGMLAGGAALLGIGAIEMNKKEEPDARLELLQQQGEYWRTRYEQAGKDVDEAEARYKSLSEQLDSGGGKSSGSESSSDSGGSSSNNTNNTNNTNSASDGWSKLSKVIRYAEGTLGDKGYTTQYTGSQFTDTSRHPRQIKKGGGYSSDAAGAYQFLSTTWDGAKKALGLTDFSPASQEKAGRYLTTNRGVNPDQIYSTKEEFTAAIDKLSKEWAGLPTAKTGTSYYGQGGKSIDDLWNRYQGF